MRAKLRGIFEGRCVGIAPRRARGSRRAVETIGRGGSIVIRDLSDVAGQSDLIRVGSSCKVSNNFGRLWRTHEFFAKARRPPSRAEIFHRSSTAQGAVETAAFRGGSRVGELHAASGVGGQPRRPCPEIRRRFDRVGRTFAAQQFESKFADRVPCWSF